MAGNKTRDGLKISRVVDMLDSLNGVNVRPGSNHPHVARSSEYAGSCPIATSTDVRRMVVPWVRSVTGYDGSKDIYNCLRSGSWDGIPSLGYGGLS